MNGKKAKIKKEKPGVARRSSGLDSDSQPLGYVRLAGLEVYDNGMQKYPFYI